MAFTSSRIGTQEAIIKPCDLSEDDEDVNWFCKDCFQNLCERCKKMHLKIPNCRNHDVVSILEGIAITKEAVSNLCQDHNVTFFFFGEHAIRIFVLNALQTFTRNTTSSAFTSISLNYIKC